MENYEKKYKEALESIKKIRDANKCNTALVESIEYFFPELAESEDEKIRKEIILFFEQEIPQCSIEEHKEYMRKWITWLEKQKEKLDLLEIFRKSVPEDWDFSKDLDLKEEVDRCYCNGMFPKYITPDTKITVSDLMRCASHFYKFGKEHKPVEWSGEDENKLKNAIKCVHYIHTDFDHNHFFVTQLSYTPSEIEGWLKSLTPQSHWKPTDYQIALLEELARNIRNNIRPFCSEVTSLESLTEQLKTL